MPGTRVVRTCAGARDDGGIGLRRILRLGVETVYAAPVEGGEADVVVVVVAGRLACHKLHLHVEIRNFGIEPGDFAVPVRVEVRRAGNRRLNLLGRDRDSTRGGGIVRGLDVKLEEPGLGQGCRNGKRIAEGEVAGRIRRRRRERRVGAIRHRAFRKQLAARILRRHGEHDGLAALVDAVGVVRRDLKCDREHRERECRAQRSRCQ